MNLPRISLDTNVVIFGLRNLNPFSVTLLKNLFRFDVRISIQVERELRKNLAEDEFRQFYDILGLTSTVHIIYPPPDERLLVLYRQLGLKTGDAKIAAFCDQEGIEILVSENRHFLEALSKRSFQIMNSQTFCQAFSLQE